MALLLKLDADGHVVVKDNKAVYVDDKDNKEFAFDPESLTKKIGELNTENAQRRNEVKELTQKLEAFGDTDPDDIEAFLEVLEELGGPEGIALLQEKGQIDVEAIKKQMIDLYEAKLLEKDGIITKNQDQLFNLLVTQQFSASKYLGDKLLLPPDIAEATFGKHFKVEDGKVVPYMGTDKILSREKPGEIASFDEALAFLVEQHPQKDRIMKADLGGGGGAGGSGNHQPGTIKSRADLKTDGAKAEFIDKNGLDAFKALPAA